MDFKKILKVISAIVALAAIAAAVYLAVKKLTAKKEPEYFDDNDFFECDNEIEIVRGVNLLKPCLLHLRGNGLTENHPIGDGRIVSMDSHFFQIIACQPAQTNAILLNRQLHMKLLLQCFD